MTARSTARPGRHKGCWIFSFLRRRIVEFGAHGTGLEYLLFSPRRLRPRKGHSDRYQHWEHSMRISVGHGRGPARDQAPRRKLWRGETRKLPSSGSFCPFAPVQPESFFVTKVGIGKLGRCGTPIEWSRCRWALPKAAFELGSPASWIVDNSTKLINRMVFWTNLEGLEVIRDNSNNHYKRF